MSSANLLVGEIHKTCDAAMITRPTKEVFLNRDSSYNAGETLLKRKEGTV